MCHKTDDYAYSLWIGPYLFKKNLYGVSYINIVGLVILHQTEGHFNDFMYTFPQQLVHENHENQ